MANILVTGANGFVGAALTRRLRNSRHQCIGASRRAIDRISNVAVGDISSTTDWGDALRGIDTVVHTAARVHLMKDATLDPLTEYRRVNRDGTLRLAEQASQIGVKRFIFVSTAKVNGECTDEKKGPGSFSVFDRPLPIGPYAISKYEAEVLLKELAWQTGMEAVVIRPPLVYGPGVSANFRALIRLTASGIPLPFSSVRNKRSFVAIDNFVDFIIRCVESPNAAGKTFFVSDDNDLATPELIRGIASALNCPCRLFPVPPALLKIAGNLSHQSDRMSRILESFRLDIEHSKVVLDWQPPMSVDEGLRRAVATC